MPTADGRRVLGRGQGAPVCRPPISVCMGRRGPLPTGQQESKSARHSFLFEQSVFDALSDCRSPRSKRICRGGQRGAIGFRRKLDDLRSQFLKIDSAIKAQAEEETLLDGSFSRNQRESLWRTIHVGIQRIGRREAHRPGLVETASIHAMR